MNSLIRMSAALAFSLAGFSALANDYTAGPLKLEQPWTRATPAGAKIAGGYLAVTNTGSTPDRLLGGTSEVSAPVLPQIRNRSGAAAVIRSPRRVSKPRSSVPAACARSVAVEIRSMKLAKITFCNVMGRARIRFRKRWIGGSSSNN